jgi:hypothetical protein
VELKLASGMTNAGRLKDLADVMELIKVLNLPADFSEQLHPYVRPKFQELWSEARKRYVQVWRDPAIPASPQSMTELSSALPEQASLLSDMQRDGVRIDDSGPGWARIVTFDPRVAEIYGLVEESEFWED